MKKKIIGIGLCVMMLFSTCAVASGAWAGRTTIRYNPGTTYGINAGMPSSKKTNNANQAAYFGKYITSMNTPHTYMVKADNKSYKLADSVKMKNDSNVRGSSWADNGTNCNVAIESSWTQGTSNTMDYDFSPNNDV